MHVLVCVWNGGGGGGGGGGGAINNMDEEEKKIKQLRGIKQLSKDQWKVKKRAGGGFT